MLSQQNTIIIESYYLHIRELIIQLEVIHLHPSNEQLKEEVVKQLKVLHNKLSITHLMADRSLLAITGLQGSGKTTIINRLYDLPDGILPENSGRGERLPVFITEKKVNNIETYVYRLNINEETRELFVEPELINPQKLDDIARHPVPNKDLWLECVVPERYLKDETKSIVLLPGFEKDQADISQLLLEHILHLSNSSVMALRKDTFARETTQNMMQKVKSIYKEVKPVIAITFGDVNPSENDAFKQHILKEFAIPENEHNRVVITGEKPKFTDDWENHFMNAIDLYGYAHSESDHLTNQLVQSLVKEIDTLLFKVNKMMDNELKQRQVSQTQFEDRRTVLMTFENEYTTVLEELEEQITATLKQRIEPARDSLRSYLARNTSWTKELKTKFFGQKPEELYLLEKKIHEIWDKPQGEVTIINSSQKQKDFLPANYDVVKVVTHYLTNLGKDVLESITRGEEISNTPKLLLETKEDNKSAFLAAISKSKAPVTANARQKNEPSLPLERVNSYFATKDELPIRLKHSDYKTMAVIGTMLIQETYAAETGINRSGIGLSTDLISESTVDIDLLKSMENLSIAAPKVLKTIPVILGIDGVIDGELDILTNASAALTSIGIKITAAQLLGIVGVGFVASYAAKAIQESMKKANERQLQLAQAGERVFNELPALQAKAFTHSLKRIFERMGKQLMDKHLELSGHYDSIGEVEHIQYILRKVGLLTQDIKRNPYEKLLLL
jgi:hypothetical protein